MASCKKITREMDVYLRKHKYVLDSSNSKRLVYVNDNGHKIKVYYNRSKWDKYKNYIIKCIKKGNRYAA